MDPAATTRRWCARCWASVNAVDELGHTRVAQHVAQEVFQVLLTAGTILDAVTSGTPPPYVLAAGRKPMEEFGAAPTRSSPF